MWRPHTLAEAARRIAEGEDISTALPELLDTFYFALQREGRAAAQACIDDEPQQLADPILQAYLGAVGEHLALRWGLRVPAWTNHPSRFLRRPYFTCDGMEGFKAMYIAQSPTAFRRRLIFTEAEPLRRARLPRTRKLGARRPWHRRQDLPAAPIVDPLRRHRRRAKWRCTLRDRTLRTNIYGTSTILPTTRRSLIAASASPTSSKR